MSLSNISVAAAQAAIEQHVPLLAVALRNLRELTGCVLAQVIQMERDQPPFDRVTMDGIALQSAAEQLHQGFRIAGTQAAGAAPLTLTSPTHCIEVMTGAQLPTGCDCVVPIERLHIESGHARVSNDVQLTPWLNVHRRASDVTAGSIVLQPGKYLNAVDVAVIASAGYAQTQVRATPRIAVISTGDELIEPGQPINDWQIRRSNSYALLSALTQQGFTSLVDEHISDDLTTLRTRLTTLLNDNDVLILSGGVSAGRFDYVPQVLNELGVQTIFHKIMQRPGRPMWFGVRADGKAVYALPGNPVSILVCLHRYVLRGLRRAMGITQFVTEQVRLVADIKAHAELTSFMPVKLQRDQSAPTAAIPWPTKGSGDFLSLLGTDGFVELPASKSMIPANSVLPLFRW